MKLTLTTVKDIAARQMMVVRLGSPKLKVPITKSGSNLVFQFDRPGFLKWSIQEFGVGAWLYAKLVLDGTSTVIPDSGITNVPVLNFDPGAYTIFFATSDADNRNESAVYEYDFTVV